MVENQTSGVNYQVIGKNAYSVADQFELLALALGRAMAGPKSDLPIKATGLLGPDGPPPSSSPVHQAEWLAFRDTLRDVVDFMRVEHRIPARVFVGAEAMAPADFLIGLASAYVQYARTGELPKGQAITFGTGTELLPAQHIAKDTPGLFGGWVIHKAGFRAPKILEVARWQAWTLKPAIRN